MDYPKKVNIIELENAPFKCAKDNQPTKAYSYEINNIEVLKGNCRTSVRPNNKTSMIDVSILLNGVCDVNGVPLQK